MPAPSTAAAAKRLVWVIALEGHVSPVAPAGCAPPFGRDKKDISVELKRVAYKAADKGDGFALRR